MVRSKGVTVTSIKPLPVLPSPSNAHMLTAQTEPFVDSLPFHHDFDASMIEPALVST